MSYTLIERKELTSAASSISFDNIPQFYSDLVILTSVRSAQDDIATEIFVAFNGSTSSFSSRQLFGSGSTVGGSTPARQTGLLPASQSTSNTFNNGTIYIPNYAGAANKSYSVDSVTENNATTAYQNIVAGLWSSTNAINSFTLTNTGGNNFVAGSSVSLYGINRQQAIGAPKAVGGQISFANGYWVHSFTGSGTFSSQEDITVDALVVGAGGGGGGRHAGGGGAGGYRYLESLKLKANSNYNVTIGSGGPGAIDGSAVLPRGGSQGTSSIFDTISSAGGGGGGGAVSETGGSGGSGGGGTYQGPVGTGNTPATTPSQGNNGGPGRFGGSDYIGGGGGGAGAVGGSASGSTAGSGGIGVSSSITGSSVFRAGGGGGGGWIPNTAGVGGLGGGGNGVSNAGSQAAQNGTANTGGGGGGGGGETSAGGTGGSGIVIIRYKA